MFAATSRIKDSTTRLRYQSDTITYNRLVFLRFKQPHLSDRTRSATSSFIPKQEQIQPKLRKNKVLRVGNGDKQAGSPLEFEDSRLSQNSRRRLVEKSTSLPLRIEVLGESGRIRVLRDPPKESNFLSTPTSKVDVKKLKEVVPQKILQDINAESGTIDTATVNSNIDQLREALKPSDESGQLPTARQCTEVAQLLLDGFTLPQLEGYLAANKPTLPTHNFDLTRNFVSKQYTRSPWISGVTSDFPVEALNRVDKAAKGWNQRSTKFDLLKDSKVNDEPPKDDNSTRAERRNNFVKDRLVNKILRHSKDRLVNRILRYSWGIRTKEEEFVKGEVDIRIDSDSLKLLLSHRRVFFQSLAQLYDAKIEVSRSHNIIRLTTDFATCFDLMKVIHFTLDNVRYEEFDLEDLQYGNRIPTITYPFLRERAILENLGKLTDTLIAVRPPEKENGLPTKFKVSYLGPDTTDMEDVQRLILQLIKPDAKGETRVFYTMRVDGRLSQFPADINIMLPWAERDSRWTRWSASFKTKPKPTQPSRHAPKKISSNLLKDEQNTMKAIAQFLMSQRLYNSSEESQADEYWHSQKRHSVGATVGQIVFPETRSEFKATLPSHKSFSYVGPKIVQFDRAFRQSIESRRIFVPSPFNVLTVLHEAKSQAPVQKHELRIRLSPTAKSNKMVKGSLPDIDLFIDIDWDQKCTKLRDARLTTEERTSDLLLPEEAVDIRFNASSHVSCLEDNVDHSILSFIDDSNLNIWGTDRLRTPSRIEISIPSHAIGLRSKLTQVDEDEPSAKSFKAEYAFLSLEQRSSLHLNHRELPMVYTTIEAGRSGGRRDELCLHHLLDGVPLKSAHGIQPLPHYMYNFGSFYSVVRDFSSKINGQ